MPGLMRKAGLYLGLVEDDEDGRGRDDDAYDRTDSYDAPATRAQPATRGRSPDRSTVGAMSGAVTDRSLNGSVPLRAAESHPVGSHHVRIGSPRSSEGRREEHRPSDPHGPDTQLSGRELPDGDRPGQEIDLRDSGYRITTLHPRSYNDARTIGEQFRQGTPVIMNLTEMDDNDAKRLVDFAAGLIFGLHGSIERVTNKVFLLSPEHIEVTAEDKARFAEAGFFNQS